MAPRSDRVRQGLIVGEIALASALLVTAVLMLQSVIRLAGTDPGFDPSRMLTLRVSVPQHGYAADEDVTRFYRQLQAELLQVPEIESAAFVSVLPMSFSESRTEVMPEGRMTARRADAERLQLRVISRDYFAALGLRPTRGSDFSAPGGTDERRVALVSGTTAQRLWGDSDPIGRRVQLGTDTARMEVLGVVPDIRHNPLVSSDPQAAVYVPLEQSPPRATSVVLRTRVDDAAAAQAILYDTNAIDPLTYAGVAAFTFAVVLLASVLPALRAASIEPGAVLNR